MPNLNINILGRTGNTRAEVTGQNELLVSVGSVSSTADLATETTLENVDLNVIQLVTNTTSVTRTPNLIRATASGTIAPLVYDFSVSNVGLANGTILGSTIKPGETLNFAAGVLNNSYTANSISYDGTGTELVIIFNS